MIDKGLEREGNAIIDTLPNKESRRLAPLCHRIALNQGEVLWESNQAMQAVYFPTSGVISLAMPLNGQPPPELGLIGREGMLGATLSLGTVITPMRAVVQLAGTALMITAAQMQQALRASSRLLELVQHYQFRLMMQTQQTATCLHFHETEHRLARWLLMVRDLSFTDTAYLTHAQLAGSLGVRRSGITHAVGSLHRRGLIYRSRNNIRIVDHAGLENAACDCYAALNHKYRTLS